MDSISIFIPSIGIATNSSLQILMKMIQIKKLLLNLNFNPIPAGGEGQFDPPCSFFSHNSQSIGLRLLKFSDFSYIPKALPLGTLPYSSGTLPE